MKRVNVAAFGDVLNVSPIHPTVMADRKNDVLTNNIDCHMTPLTRQQLQQSMIHLLKVRRCLFYVLVLFVCLHVDWLNCPLGGVCVRITHHVVIQSVNSVGTRDNGRQSVQIFQSPTRFLVGSMHQPT